MGASSGKKAAASKKRKAPAAKTAGDESSDDEAEPTHDVVGMRQAAEATGCEYGRKRAPMGQVKVEVSTR